MASYVLTTVGSAGDVYPLVALGAELKRRGNRVSFVYNPYFQEAIESAGLHFVSVGEREQFERLMTDPDLWHPVRGFHFIAREAIVGFLRPVYAVLAGFDPQRSILVSSSLAAAARLAQEALGFRLATVHLQSALFLSAHLPAETGGLRLPTWLPLSFRKWWLNAIERLVVDRALAPGFNRFRKELGLPMATHFFSRWMHSPDLVLGLWPTWYSTPQPDWPANLSLTGFVSYEPSDQAVPPEVERFLSAGPPPIVFTPGSAMQHGKAFFEAAAKACQTLGQRGILLTRFREHLPERIPDRLIHAEWLPLGKVLPRTALMVHHGGIGTTAQVLRAGIPHLVMPLAHDQPDNANILRRLGVGARLDPARFTADRVAEHLRDLLNDPAVRANCARYARKVDFSRSLQRAGDLLESLA